MKSLFLKLASLVAALVIWILVAGTTMVEADVGLPLDVAGLADGLTVEGSTLPDQGLVRLRASRLRLLAHQYFGRSLGSVQVDLTGLQPGPPLFLELKDADVRTEAEVVSILPPVRLRLQLDWLESRRLPVHVPLNGNLPPDRLLAGPVVVRPDSLDVKGPRRFFSGLDSLFTDPVDLSTLQRTFARDLQLVLPARPLRVSAQTIHATIPVTQLGMRVLANVPVQPEPRVDVGGAGILPPVCDVLVRGPADSVASLSPERFIVTVPVSGLDAGVHQVPGMIRHPDWVVSIQLEPSHFMVLVGQDSTVEAMR